MEGAGSITVLYIDSDIKGCEMISQLLTSPEYKVMTALNADNGIDLFSGKSFDLVIINISEQDTSGLDIIKHINENRKHNEIIVLSEDKSVETAVSAMQAGASEYLIRPVMTEKLLQVVNRAISRTLSQKKAIDRDILSQFDIIGESPGIKKLYKMIEKAARTKATVLINGESGTGKELVARAIHYSGKRQQAPFIPVNCGGIPETLLESELFGYVKGSFTGAQDSRQGFFQTADGGTIFLDEIGEMSMAMQVKLLRVLQEKQFFMIGARKPIEVDIKIIAATNKDLKLLVERGLFREDLFYRLHVISIEIPPLRDRGEDILLLINHFMKKYAGEFEKPIPGITNAALNALCKYRWPGNIRELENTIQMLIAMNDEEKIDLVDMPRHMRLSPTKGIPLNKTLAEVEREYIHRVLSSVGGNRSKAARILGIDRKTLWDKLKKESLPVSPQHD